jgi:hypothetical protein
MTIKAHKVILAAASPVFRKMLSENDFVEGKQGNSLVLTDLNHNTLEQLLCYVYTGSISLTGATQLLKLYQAGDRYDISSLCKACLEEARRWVSFSTCIEMLMGSWLLGLMDLHAYCETFVLQNFEAVSMLMNILAFLYS